MEPFKDDATVKSMRAAIEHLELELNKRERSADETRDTINCCLNSIGEPDRYVLRTPPRRLPRHDLFYGRSFSLCAIEALDLAGCALTISEIESLLRLGGFDFDTEFGCDFVPTENWDNPSFHTLPNGSIGLVRWYDAKFIEKIEKRKLVNA